MAAKRWLQSLWTPSVVILVFMILSRLVWMQIRSYPIEANLFLESTLSNLPTLADSWQGEIHYSVFTYKGSVTAIKKYLEAVDFFTPGLIQTRDFVHFQFLLFFLVVMSCLFLSRMSGRGWWVALAVATMILSRGHLIELIGETSCQLAYTSLITCYFMWTCHYFITGSVLSFLFATCTSACLSLLNIWFLCLMPLISIFDLVGVGYYYTFRVAKLPLGFVNKPSFFTPVHDDAPNQVLRLIQARKFLAGWPYYLNILMTVALLLVCKPGTHSGLEPIVGFWDIRDHWKQFYGVPVPVDVHLGLSVCMVLCYASLYARVRTSLAKICFFVVVAGGVIGLMNAWYYFWMQIGANSLERVDVLERFLRVMPYLVDWFEPVILSLAVVIFIRVFEFITYSFTLAMASKVRQWVVSRT